MIPFTVHGDAIIRDYYSGVSLSQLIRQYHISHGRLRQFLIERGAPIRLKGDPQTIHYVLTEEQQIELCRRYEAGETSTILRKAFNIGQSTVMGVLQRRGIQRRKGGIPKGRIQPALLTIPNDPAKLGYMAGMIDGEGTIHTKPTRNSVAIRVSVFNSDHSVMDWLQQHFGGKVYWRTRSGTHLIEGKPITYRKPMGVWWTERAQDSHNLLTAVLPYLVIKRERAVIALEKLRSSFRLIALN